MMLSGSAGRRFRSRGWGRVATALVLAGSLSGCGQAETGLQRDAARQLQERVLSVSQAAAANDPTAALAALDTLEAELSTAAGNGHVSQERRRMIMTVVTAVRADLTSAVQAAAAKAAQDAAAAAAEKARVAAEAAAAAKAAQQAAAPVAPTPAPANNSKGSPGKGKDD